MGFKFSVTSILTAITVGATALGNAWVAASTNATPGVQAEEVPGLVIATLIAIGATLFHDSTVPKV